MHRPNLHGLELRERSHPPQQAKHLRDLLDLHKAGTEDSAGDPVELQRCALGELLLLLGEGLGGEGLGDLEERQGGLAVDLEAHGGDAAQRPVVLVQELGGAVALADDAGRDELVPALGQREDSGGLGERLQLRLPQAHELQRAGAAQDHRLAAHAVDDQLGVDLVALGPGDTLAAEHHARDLDVALLAVHAVGLLELALLFRRPGGLAPLLGPALLLLAELQHLLVALLDAARRAEHPIEPGVEAVEAAVHVLHHGGGAAAELVRVRGGHGLHGADHAVGLRGGVAAVGDALVALELQRHQLLLVPRHLLRQEIARVVDSRGATCDRSG